MRGANCRLIVSPPRQEREALAHRSSRSQDRGRASMLEQGQCHSVWRGVLLRIFELRCRGHTRGHTIHPGQSYQGGAGRGLGSAGPCPPRCIKPCRATDSLAVRAVATTCPISCGGNSRTGGYYTDITSNVAFLSKQGRSVARNCLLGYYNEGGYNAGGYNEAWSEECHRRN